METYARVHIESNKTITAEVTAKGHAWSVRVKTEENGRTSAIAYSNASTLDDAQKSADAFVRKDHNCNDRCGDWTRVQPAG
jgi:hypothetical protein